MSHGEEGWLLLPPPASCLLPPASCLLFFPIRVYPRKSAAKNDPRITRTTTKSYSCYFVDRFFLATSHERHNFFWRSMKPGNKLESLEFERVGWVMDYEKHWQRKRTYQPEAWRDDSYRENRDQNHEALPATREQTRILELLGRINYKIIQGNRVYVEVDGVVYKTLYGGYWRSVFTGVEHYLLRCEQVSGSPWADDDRKDWTVDLPIAYSNHAWTANGHSLSYMLSRD